MVPLKLSCNKYVRNEKSAANFSLFHVGWVRKIVIFFEEISPHIRTTVSSQCNAPSWKNIRAWKNDYSSTFLQGVSPEESFASNKRGMMPYISIKQTSDVRSAVQVYFKQLNKLVNDYTSYCRSQDKVQQDKAKIRSFFLFPTKLLHFISLLNNSHQILVIDNNKYVDYLVLQLSQTVSVSCM